MPNYTSTGSRTDVIVDATEPATPLCPTNWRTQEDLGTADGLGVGATFFKLPWRDCEAAATKTCDLPWRDCEAAATKACDLGGGPAFLHVGGPPPANGQVTIAP